MLSVLIPSAVFGLWSPLMAADSDSDGLEDAHETGTGVYVSPTDTGTDPNDPDSDGDGVGDWYEVAASITDPNDPAKKPNVPYPLPAPDGQAGNTASGAPPVKVYILAGQSNMQGHGFVGSLGSLGTLEQITRGEHKFPNLLSGDGWAARQDVIYRGVISANGANGPLAPGQGVATNKIGPELGFGHIMGYYHDEPVLIIKSSQGGRALGWDFLPPGSVSYNYGSKTYAGYGDSPASWTIGEEPVPTNFYGGHQFDQCFMDEADWHSSSTFSEVVNVTDILDDFSNQFPEWSAQGFEIAGFAWFQGWNDGLSSTAALAYRYEQNLAQFIRQIRSYYENRYPDHIRPKAPFVIATAAFNGWDESYLNRYPTRRAVIDAQLAMADPDKYPEFEGNVKTIEARHYWRLKEESSGGQEYHYNQNAETFMLVGDALGRAMIDLRNLAVPNNFTDWISNYDVGDLTGFGDDPDKDGITNGMENYLGTDPSAFSAAVTLDGTSGTGLSFSHPINPAQSSDVVASYRWTSDLKTFHGSGATNSSGSTVTFEQGEVADGVVNVTATVSGTPLERVFVVIQVNQG